MKRLVSSLFTLMLTSFVWAQSHNAGFIDSPSWVLAKEKDRVPAVQTRDTEEPGKGVPAASYGKTAGAHPQQAIETGHTGAVARNTAAKAKGKSSQGMVPMAPKKEGFLHVGIYVAPVVNWLSSLNAPYKRSGVNICATPTVMLDMRMIGRLYLGVGVAYNTIGGRLAYPTVDNLKHERSYMFSYVEVPVRLKWQTPNFGSSKSSLFISGGLNLGFGVEYKYKDIYEGALSTNIGVLDGVFKVKNTMKKDSRLVNLAAVAQFGYNYQILPRVNLVIGVEYHYGFIRPVKKGKYVDGVGKPIYNNQQCGLILGVMF